MLLPSINQKLKIEQSSITLINNYKEAKSEDKTNIICYACILLAHQANKNPRDKPRGINVKNGLRTIKKQLSKIIRYPNVLLKNYLHKKNGGTMAAVFKLA